MNRSLSTDLHRWADEEPDGPKQRRLRCAAVRACIMESELQQAKDAASWENPRMVRFPGTTTKETLRLHLVQSLQMFDPPDSAA